MNQLSWWNEQMVGYVSPKYDKLIFARKHSLLENDTNL